MVQCYIANFIVSTCLKRVNLVQMKPHTKMLLSNFIR